ncbi:Oxidoreductase-like N-terminal [Penicillium argentinense]|uniref:Oxidoreductase-like N-terminal n=1 Tax=Penicillium argentinense TaxID=1131581 RepID=A0A9W9EYS6_9EURO|nr:Oxidoreductase-like N-terminal [Penicillium argentinense]KAJ5090453.1 Oxidoreductase-like N-terminal [Penicillium argentinense]
MGARDHSAAQDVHAHAHAQGAPAKSTDSSQAYPHSGYYSLILNSPSPYLERPRTGGPTEAQPEEKPAPSSIAEAQTPQEKMAIVFGTRLAGPGRQSRYNPGEAPPVSQWKTINGVPIPPRPEEPDNCCMSGCVNCVWDGFRDEMEEWAARVEKAKAKGGPEKGTGDMRAAPRAEVNSASVSMDDDGGGSEANWPAPSQGEDLFSNIPVGIREFMKTEKKLKVKHKQEATA